MNDRLKIRLTIEAIDRSLDQIGGTDTSLVTGPVRRLLKSLRDLLTLPTIPSSGACGPLERYLREDRDVVDAAVVLDHRGAARHGIALVREGAGASAVLERLTANMAPWRPAGEHWTIEVRA